MGNAITQDVRAIWLTLRDSGSWWSVNALTRHWAPTYANFEVREALEALCAAGFAERRTYDTREVQYCFTSSCKALPELPAERQLGAIT